MSGIGGVQLEGARGPAAALLLRRRAQQRDVAAFYARRFQRVQLVPQGAPGRGPVLVDNFEKVVLQKDFLNVVGGVDSQSNGLAEIEVTRDADGGMRFYAETDVHLVCKNTSGVTITKGTPVYVTGSVGATTTVEISASDAGNAAKMPAIGLLEQTLAPNEFGRVVAVGVLSGLDTSAYSINQTAYIAVGGGLTGTRPTAATALVQNIGRVLRVNGSNGEILVLGAGRTNDVPNYNASRLLGRGSASGAGPAQEITVSTGLSLVGTSLSASQDLFRAIVVAGQNTIYASGSDSLEFVAGSNITLTTDDTLKTVTIDAAGGGGGGGGNTGKTTVDFGAFPGKSDAVVTVTGQTGIVSGSVVQAWLVPEATADHTADEHRLETISIMAGNIVANTSFDIYAQNISQLTERLASHTPSTFRSTAAAALGDSQPSIGGQGTRIYGAWTVAWRWS